MRILTVLTYYRPHISGLTIYAERLAQALVKRGHDVTILTAQFDKSLPREEIQEGVKIVREPVAFRLSKGVIMPGFGFTASKLVAQHDVIQLHLPQFDAAGVALRGRLMRKPTVITYHCDLFMPPGVIAWMANQAVRVMNNLTAVFTHKIVTYTRDYAENSSFLRRYIKKLHVIPPPVVLPEVGEGEVLAFGQEHNPAGNRPVIGMAARFATEKGVEILLGALPRVLQEFPKALVMFAGPHRNILGEEDYERRLTPLIDAYQKSGNWKFVGVLNPRQMSTFYPNIDALVLPSLNSTEAFGLVQIEAMINQKPCVASSLPGVRQPVLQHEMGKVVPIGDAAALAEALIQIFKDPAAFQRDPAAIARKYQPDSIAQEYEGMFEQMLKDMGRSSSSAGK